MTHRLRLPPNPPPPAEVRGRAVALSGRPGGCERAGGCAPGRADPTAAHSHPSPLPTGRWVPRSCPRRQRGGGAAGAAPLLTRNAARDKDAAFPPPTKGDALPRPSRRRGALTAPRSPLPSSPPLLPARRGAGWRRRFPPPPSPPSPLTPSQPAGERNRSRRRLQPLAGGRRATPWAAAAEPSREGGSWAGGPGWRRRMLEEEEEEEDGAGSAAPSLLPAAAAACGCCGGTAGPCGPREQRGRPGAAPRRNPPGWRTPPPPEAGWEGGKAAPTLLLVARSP